MAGCVPPDGLLASMVEAMLADRGEIAWLLDMGSGPAVERLLNPKLPRMLLEGMVPSDVPATGGGGGGGRHNDESCWEETLPCKPFDAPCPGDLPPCSQLLLVLS